ncbi:uncharacterized protein STEHIDRAFT_120298 [Stereum hirsutum FP-91666 SS1]|uniref:uncharacterized protein n=1 Tax=Stereum hirsutum (strain FP-91666) TaxID=721885 RepID=UPI000440BC0F|nr:uncharacterized protein STEHIDRAFT_120298 [Stereum hirsutum FP-91666 SS1]EIM88092.1 hypothetical protein STEHIDRAFT_120298 [Stereum hirsutum FP-91666 SS1]
MDTLAAYDKQIRPNVCLPKDIKIVQRDVAQWLHDEHALSHSSSQAGYDFVFRLTTETIGLWVQALTAAFAELMNALTYFDHGGSPRKKSRK